MTKLTDIVFIIADQQRHDFNTAGVEHATA